MMMAKEMTKSGEFLLPNDFFSDDFFIDRNGNGGSNPSSPVESVTGTKSENEDTYISALTQQMTSSFLHEDYKNMPSQSTFCGVRNPSKVSSAHDQDFLRCVSNHALIQQQLQATRFYELKRQQQLIRVKQMRSINCYGDEKQGPSLRLPNSIWPHIQKQQRAVFPNGARRASKGTGVFLPTRVKTQNEPSKKQDCSTVLIPARVVQALNLNLDDVHRRVPGTYLIDQETLIGRGNAILAQGKRNPRAVGSAHDLRLLPPEWTY